MIHASKATWKRRRYTVQDFVAKIRYYICQQNASERKSLVQSILEVVSCKSYNESSKL
jgi:hypothetical protein